MPILNGTTIYIYELVNFHLMRQMGGFVKIHAACGSLNGVRFLLAGEKGVGKTTLATRLLFEDVAVHGDEKVLIRNRDVIPLPRKFHLKEGSVRLIPQIGPIWDRKIAYPAANGMRLCFFDPTDAGFHWQTKWDKVDIILYLEPNHGKSTDIESCPKWLMAQKLILQSLDFDTNPESHIDCLCKMVAQTESFLLRIGDLDGAVTAIKGILSKT